MKVEGSVHNVQLMENLKCFTNRTIGLVVLFIVSGCHQMETETSDERRIQQILVSSDWKINFLLAGKNATQEFSDYAFTFNIDNTVRATSTSITMDGTWSISKFGKGKSQLLLNFAQADPFQELNKNWTVVDCDETVVRFSQDNGGPSAEISDVSKLTIEKI
jgi:hypothetical protein